MTQIEKIKSEIERLRKHYENSVQEFDREGYTSNVFAEQSRIKTCDQLLNFINSLQAEPVSEDLELASERYACRFSSSKYGYDKIKTAFKAGADWQERQDNICYEEIFEEGAKWQKERMLKDAVEGKVLENDADNGDSALVYIDGKQLYPDQRVKLIIVKEN